jgi:low temperature requirement protein LtrA
MVSGAFFDMLPLALGVAISPIPIVAVILMVMSKRAARNGLAFVAGWIAALLVVVDIILWLAAAGKISVGENGPSTASSVVLLTLGIALLVMAGKSWMSRPDSRQKPVAPLWMAAIDRFSRIQSHGRQAVDEYPPLSSLVE